MSVSCCNRRVLLNKASREIQSVTELLQLTPVTACDSIQSSWNRRPQGGFLRSVSFIFLVCHSLTLTVQNWLAEICLRFLTTLNTSLRHAITSVYFSRKDKIANAEQTRNQQAYSVRITSR